MTYLNSKRIAVIDTNPPIHPPVIRATILDWTSKTYIIITDIIADMIIDSIMHSINIIRFLMLIINRI